MLTNQWGNESDWFLLIWMNLQEREWKNVWMGFTDCFHCMHIYLPWYSALCMHSISLVSMHLSLDSMKAVLLSDSFFLEFSRKHLRLKYLLLHQRNDIFMWQQLFTIIIDLFMTPDLMHSICLCDIIELCMTPELLVHSSSASHVEYRASGIETIIQPVGRQPKA